MFLYPLICNETENAFKQITVTIDKFFVGFVDRSIRGRYFVSIFPNDIFVFYFLF